jgi:hypothetical protein
VGWKVFRPAFFRSMPIVARNAVTAFARSGVRRALRGQGYGRHSAAEIQALGTAGSSDLATIVGTQGFAVSDRPTSFDATLYVLRANIVGTRVETVLTLEAWRDVSLTAYLERMRATFETLPGAEKQRYSTICRSTTR